MSSGENRMEAEFRLNKLQLFALLTLLFAATFALAQGIATGTISGTVVDPSGAVVSGANVTATNVETNMVSSTQSNDSGYFTFRAVVPGTYKITIDAKGFRKVQVSQVVVQVAKESGVGSVKMELAAASGETVEVVEAAPILETTTAQVTNTFDAKATADLPTGGGFDSLALYLPGVADSGSNNFSNTNGAGISSNGLRGRSNNFQIDGQSNNDNSVAGPSIFLGNQDLLGEVSVITNDFSVEYGRASGSVVNYVTKSGTNQFHGSAFEYWTGSRWDAHTNEEKSGVFNFCATGQNPDPDGIPGSGDECTPVSPISKYVENRFGFTLGGPIYKNKAWFFGSGYWDRVRSAGAPATSSNLTPTPNGLTQLAAAFPGNPAVAALNTIGPYAVQAGNPHISGVPETLTVTDGVTSADVEFAGVTRNPPSLFNDREFSGKVDVNITNKDRVGARYIFQQNILTAATAGPGGFAAGAWVDIPARDQQIALDWTRTFSSQMVNQLRYSFSRAGFGFEAGSFPSCTRANIFACPTSIVFQDNTLNFGLANNLPQGRTINNTQIQDNASWAHGRHTIKFGGEFLKQRSPNTFLPSVNGRYTFSSFDGFLSDTPAALTLTDGPAKFNFKEYDLAFYGGDDWRIKDNLTVNLGLRWEYSSQAVNLLHDLSVANQAGSDPFWDPTLSTSVTTVPKISSPLNYFGPNIGFAWKPRFLGGGDKTVIRGGFRITYDPAFYNIFLNVATAAPVVNAGSIACTPTPTAPCLPTSGFTGADVRSEHLSDIPRGGNPGKANNTRVGNGFREPYTEGWSLGIQHELTNRLVLEVRYVGNHVVGNFQTVNANPALCIRDPETGDCVAGLVGNGFSNFIPAGVTPCDDPTQPGFATGRADCRFRNVRNRVNSAFSSYNGLQSEFRVREWHGLSGAASFTWSKTMDNTSEIFSTGSGGNSVAGSQDPFNTGAGEKSLSGLDFPKLASFRLVYDLPFYKGQHGFLGKALGGWQANTIWHYSTGQNYTPLTVPGPSSSCQTSFDANFFGPSTCRPFLGNPAAPIDTVGFCADPTATDCGLSDWFTGAPTTLSAVHWLYNEDGTAQFLGTPYSNVRRNPGTRGQNISAVNFSMFKTTKLNERVSVRLEAQVFNLFNHQFRGVPDPFIDDVNFANRLTLGGGSFANNLFNSSGGDYTNATLNGIGRRRMILGAKFTF
jgi:outer membrane receptor protein involved in Fe transport